MFILNINSGGFLASYGVFPGIAADFSLNSYLWGF
jgi:hypothetical protein